MSGIVTLDFLVPGGKEIYLATTDGFDDLGNSGYIPISMWNNLSVSPSDYNVIFVQYLNGFLLYNPVIDPGSGDVSLNPLF